jgi:NADPH:quinone reductase
MEDAMRAIAVSEYGGSPMVSDLPKPQPGPGQLTIRIEAAAMNPMDRKIADGAWRSQMAATFPLVPGADVAGVVEELGSGATRFASGDKVFGQLLIAPIGSAGTYAEQVAVPEEAPLALVPGGLEASVAATLPTAGSTGLDVVDSLPPLFGKTVLIVGAGGGVGAFATQFAANAGAHVIANAHAAAADRLRGYGAAEIVDRAVAPISDAVLAAHSDGIDVLIDLASPPETFAELASLVRPGGTALTTLGVADLEALAALGVTGLNYGPLSLSPELLRRVADAVVAGRIVPPPITRIGLDDVPSAWERMDHADGKTVIMM